MHHSCIRACKCTGKRDDVCLDDEPIKRVSENIDVLLTRFLADKKATHADIIAQIRGTPRQQFRQVCAAVASRCLCASRFRDAARVYCD